MSIPVTCGHCFESFHVKEQFAGKTIRCKGCGAPMPVVADPGFSGGDYQPAPSRPRKRPRKKQPSAAPKIVAIVLGSLFGVALLGVGIWFAVSRAGGKEEPNSSQAKVASASSTLPVWTPDQDLLSKLTENAAEFGRYELRIPHGYTSNRMPFNASLGAEVRGVAWIGPIRNDGTRAQVMVNAIKLPASVPNRRTPEELLDRRLSATKVGHTGWTQTESTQGKVNGRTFVRKHWSGTSRKFERKMHGFIYVSLSENEIIYLSSQDVELFHQGSLPLAEASILTFRDRIQ